LQKSKNGIGSIKIHHLEYHMITLFKKMIFIFSVFLLLSRCTPPEEIDSSNTVLLSEAYLEQVILENGGTVRERDYMDKHGNRYRILYDNPSPSYLNVYLYNMPDMDVLLQLKNHIKNLQIKTNDSNITDISFLENLQLLRTLDIEDHNQNINIVTFESLRRIPSLELIRVYIGYSSRVEIDFLIDFSIFLNMKNLKKLIFYNAANAARKNLEILFDFSREEFKLPNLNSLEIGQFQFSKSESSSLLASIEGITMTDDKNTREQYGNSRGDHYADQYGNTFSRESSKEGISVTISQEPDLEVLSKISGHITFLRIEETSPLSDLSFLKRSSRLKELTVNNSSIKTFEPLTNSASLYNISINNPNIEAIESLRFLYHLRSLRIDLSISINFLTESGYVSVLDFLHYMDYKARLNDLIVSDGSIEDMDEMYLLAQEMIKISNLKRVIYDGNYFFGDQRKSLELRLGTYHVLQYRANVRSEPNRNSNVIAILSLNDEVEIKGRTNFEEKINNVWGFWYRIWYNGCLEGYIFGGSLALNTFETDIDKNGVHDYFYFRASGRRTINPHTDVIIYINNQRINTSVLESKRYFDDRPFEWCTFGENDGYVLVGLSQEGRHGYEYMTVYKVMPNGRIEYVADLNEIDYW